MTVLTLTTKSEYKKGGRENEKKLLLYFNSTLNYFCLENFFHPKSLPQQKNSLLLLTMHTQFLLLMHAKLLSFAKKKSARKLTIAESPNNDILDESFHGRGKDSRVDDVRTRVA